MPLPADQNSQNHESFEIPDNAASRRERNIREDRFLVKDANCLLKVGDAQFDVMNYSAFGLAVLSPESLANRTVIENAVLELNSVPAANVSLKKVREEVFGDLHKVAFEVIGEPINIGKINAYLQTQDLLVNLDDTLQFEREVPSKIRECVYEIKDTLQQLEIRLEQLQQQQEFTSNFEIQSFETAVADKVARYLQDLLEPMYEKLAPTLKDLAPEKQKICFEFYRAKLLDVMMLSPVVKRSNERPLGYAGDFEMMNLIYRNENIGKNLFAKCLHRYYINHPNAEAVRNRSEYLFSLLSETIKKRAGKPTKFLSVASGPAREVLRLVESDVDLSNVEFRLLDQDLSALRNAQANIREASVRLGREIDVKFYHQSIKNIIKGSLTEKFDTIYSAGLFDYFSDPVAKLAGQKLLEVTNPGGEVIIGNFTGSPNYQTLMQLAMDWHLIYRDQNDLKRLYDDFANVTVEAEPQEINLFVRLRQK